MTLPGYVFSFRLWLINPVDVTVFMCLAEKSLKLDLPVRTYSGFIMQEYLESADFRF